MKNKSLYTGCGIATALLLFAAFSLYLMKSVGAFSIPATHGTPLERIIQGLSGFHWNTTFVAGWLLSSGFMFFIAALVMLNFIHEHDVQPAKGIRSSVNLINIFALFFSTLFITAVFAFIGVDPHHDGIMLKPAMDVAEGKILFKETFTQYGAFTVLMQAAALALFGKSLLVLRLLTSLFYGFIAILLYVLFKSFLKKWQAVLAVVAWLLMAPFYLENGGISVLLPWSSVYSLSCQIICLIVCIRYYKRNSPYLPVLCGVFAVLAFFFRQPVGVTTMGALIVSISTLSLITKGTRGAAKALISLIAGFTLVFAGFLVYQLAAGSLVDWYRQSIEFAANWNGIATGKNFKQYLVSSFLVIGFPYTQAWLWRILPAACCVLLMVTSYRLFIKKKATEENKTLFIVAVGCLSSWPQYYPIPCNTHLFWAATPMFGAAVYCFRRLADYCPAGKIKGAVFALLLLCTFGPEVKNRIHVGFNKAVSNFENNAAAESPLIKGMIIPMEQAAGFARLYDTVHRYLNDNPEKTVVNLGRDALFSALSGNRKNAHCVYVNWGNYTTGVYPDYYKDLAVFIWKELPVVLVPENTYDGRDFLDPLLKQCNYRTLMKTDFGFVVMAPSSR